MNMTNSLRELLQAHQRTEYATDAGTRMHARLQRVKIDAGAISGDADLVRAISSCNGLAEFFVPSARTEVPIAGIINGKFISRRIDRLIIDTAAQTIRILDYKTDINRDAMRGKYIAQLNEYAELLRQIYPTFAIEKYILWTHDWTLERI